MRRNLSITGACDICGKSTKTTRRITTAPNVTVSIQSVKTVESWGNAHKSKITTTKKLILMSSLCRMTSMVSVQIHQTCLCECPHVVCIDANMPHGSVRAEVSRVCRNCIFALWWQVSSCRHVAGTDWASVVIVKNKIKKLLRNVSATS